jgi:hypothetical protein
MRVYTYKKDVDTFYQYARIRTWSLHQGPNLGEISMENTFRQWLQDNYSHNELADIANHGCSGGVSGMIYYTETNDLYKKHSESLHETLSQYKDAVGVFPEYVTDELHDDTRFFNAVVWFAAEWLAQNLTQGEYIDEATA